MSTDTQLQLALAKMLPEGTLDFGEYYTDPVSKKQTGMYWFHWRGEQYECRDVKETEWLHVCWLVEQTLIPTRRGQYNAELSLIVCTRCLSSAVKEPEYIYNLLNASWQQRAEALAKIKGINI